MNTARERLIKIIESIPDQEVDKILDFAEYLESKHEKKLAEDLTKASESSLDFWDNDIDDRIWNRFANKLTI